MRPTLMLAAAGFVTLALAGCGSSSKSTSSATTAVPPTTAAPTTTASPTTTVSTTQAAPSGTATVSLVTNAKIGKPIFVDSKGMTLYVWDKDMTPGKATCTGGCATAWPPLYVTGTPTYGTGLTAGMFSTVTGPNGQKQLAVNGKPLYRWASDTKAGDATGQNVNGFYVVGSNGKKIDNS
jgi:predicted lipoprotein with Yx(FWY)xxD motif